MLSPTVNVCNVDYNHNQTFLVGTETGCLKAVTLHDGKTKKMTLIGNSESSAKQNDIQSLEFADSTQDEVLIGRKGGILDVYSFETDNVISTYSCGEKTNPAENCTVVGVAKHENVYVAATASGKIQLFTDKNVECINACSNISTMTQCRDVPNLVAVGGKDNDNILRIFDLLSSSQTFVGKNTANNHMQLTVPVWESDLRFVDPNVVATCSRTGYVRLYDVRKQRRPVLVYVKEDTSFSCLEAFSNQIYTGTTTGGLFNLDVRKLNRVTHTYKGFQGGVSQLRLSDSGRYLISGSLDRYIRVHDTSSSVKLYQYYVLSKVLRILLKPYRDKSRSQVL